VPGFVVYIKAELALVVFLRKPSSSTKSLERHLSLTTEAVAAPHVMAGPTGHLSVSATDDDFSVQVANIVSGTDVAL